ncbi:HEAT repeat domain-containing protein [Sphingopyxis sp. YF1]|nr:HEAT repeat domain-containing protein [Sphingopyxis sp. YF1]
MTGISRHDHYPHTDGKRRRAIRRAAGTLAAGWRGADEAPGGLLAALEAASDLAPDDAIDRLLPWLADTGWLRARIGAALSLLAADAFARPPLRIVGGGGVPGGMILAERGAIRLSLQLLPFETAAPPATALFVPGRAAIRVLVAGGARLTLHHVALTAIEEAGAFTAAGAAPCRNDPPRALLDGAMLRIDTARTSFTIAGPGPGPGRDVLLLELVVQPPSPLPMRSYDPGSGRLIHVAASRRDSSFRQMALGLLREMGRRDAASLFAAAVGAADFASRWAAMRDFVALDPAAAFPHLARMAAGDPHPEVRRAAASTLALYPACPANARDTGSAACRA